MTTKSEKRAQRKERKKDRKEKQNRGRWTSNVTMVDATKIKKAFPATVIEGEPRATSGYSVEDLTKEGIVGLYERYRKDEETATVR